MNSNCPHCKHQLDDAGAGCFAILFALFSIGIIAYLAVFSIAQGISDGGCAILARAVNGQPDRRDVAIWEPKQAADCTIVLSDGSRIDGSLVKLQGAVERE